VLIVDESLLPLYEKFRGQTAIDRVIVIGADSDCSGGPGVSRSDASLGGAGSGRVEARSGGFLDYEGLLAGADPSRVADVDLPESEAAAMCYTSGTTGRPKGVLYSHRALVLHSFAQGIIDAFGIGERDTILPIVPMFHVNAWGLPFTATLFGANQVFPGPHLDARSVLDLIVTERVTLTAGVPTVWLGVLQELDSQPGVHDLSSLRAIIVGGSAAPTAMIRGFKERHGIDVVHAWGMTEMTPLGTICHLPSSLSDAPLDEQYRYRSMQGKPLPFVEIRARTEQGLVPWDGQTMGELEVRGPWVAAQYYNVEGPDARFTADGWFRTGDIVTINGAGCIELTDRAKDLVKSGGEWISSVALENALMGHPKVAEAAVVAVPHPKWDERPLAVVVLKAGQTATPDELLAFIEPSFAKWWLPDRIEFATEIPRTSAGKFKKSALREKYRDHYQSV
jgi:fatty-acyl-CoA synthase